ncbi:MAG: FAD-binding oxidoreductase [Mesorhizobium sp.]|uniref:FAD-binding oxidoreductase n=1 Tax=Mesorhizobium sp. TaxID=1871066 RepID=UPI0011F6680E|nr:FAD-binding oxidoreductase [Mesorhizobium sp.]TIO53929.1 MAG: FAD-binding oxidoreductase [Mesorhizobium sp.]TIO61556.1 MAG: FAD-binding oxidoreductase [Mesorhizobium sp.]TJV65942.1 MAG: FAD-binding oxidoreductase [Mesorhizobium sp.]
MAVVESKGRYAGFLEGNNVEELRRRLAGTIVRPGDSEYDRARAVWNGMIDRRPAIIVYCANVDDVIQSIAFARETGILASVRSGGHNIAGSSLCDGGLVIDLSRMNKVTVDPENRIARAEGGAFLADLDAATQAHGLATTTGVNSDTGLIALTLGGGIGRLGRKHGLSCDNMLSAEIITADGQLLFVSEKENAELFWGLRGGGGNFGIVTAITYRLHPLGPTVLAGSLVYDWKRVRDALRLYAEFSAAAPDELCTDAALVTLPDGGHGFAISAFYAGPMDEGERILRPLRDALPLVQDRIGAISYVQLQRAGDASFPRGHRFYWKAQFLRKITYAAADALIDRFPSVPSPKSFFVFQQVGGAIARVSPTATAYVNRNAAYDSFPVCIWTDPADDQANISWAREMYAALQPFAMDGVYVNNLGDEGDDRVKAAYGANYTRLVALKRKYDPDNLFRLNQNIRPAV